MRTDTNTRNWITIADIAHRNGIELEAQTAARIGREISAMWSREIGSRPQVKFAAGQSGHGSYAVYPQDWWPRIEEHIRQHAGDSEGPATAAFLYDTLKLLNDVADHRALSINYRVLLLTPGSIHAAAPWGTMRIDADLGLTSEVCVDAADFIGILKTAPNKPFEVTVRDNALHWQCGAARGRLGTIEAHVMQPEFPGDMIALHSDFGDGLDLGGAACGRSNALRNAGLEGIQLYNDGDRAYAVASDGIVVSSCCLGPALPMTDGSIVTLNPKSANLLAEVVNRQDGDMAIGVNDNSLYFLADGIELYLNQLAPLPINFADKLKPFTGQKQSVPLMHETVGDFLKRAELLAEVKRDAMVEVSHKDGRTTLKFSEATNSTEEYYDILSSGPKVTMTPVRIEVRRLAKVLKHASHLVFDHAAENILVLRGDNEFTFAIYGQA